MNEIQIFKNEQFGEIHTLEINGQLYFVGIDVAKSFDYRLPRKAILDHVNEEDKMIFNLNIVPIQNGIQKRGNPNVIIINESGVYSLIMSSKLPDAKKFKHWVTSEVLPEIRCTGGYGNRSLSNEIIYENPDTLEWKIDALERNSESRTDKIIDTIKKSIINATNHILVPCFSCIYNKFKSL